ncbi:hypothetical protein AL1_26850 [Alistipes shahii WAL 8301]|jgi:hypothetical protein|uniref:Uncharacterized protein n=1 Tax=Alistipes shahii WAL 8301 TaxID=717959 RepID=D4IPJ6_9BACT|nr:hypothetical protein AL1_26850 [Alistipes shahii WAL 8301]
MKPEAKPEEAEMEVLKLKLKSKTRIGLQQRRNVTEKDKEESYGGLIKLGRYALPIQINCKYHLFLSSTSFAWPT